MKRSNLLRISIFPLIVFSALAVSNIQPPQGKGKNEKAQGQSSGKGNENAHGTSGASPGHPGNAGKGSHAQDHRGNSQGQGASNTGGQGQANEKRRQGSAGRPQGYGNKQDQENGRGNSRKAGKNPDINGKPGRGEGREEHAGRGKMYRGNGNSIKLNGRRDTEIDWGFDDFGNRRRPGQKKVTICHHAGGTNSEYPVTISVSENAVQAHLNHGDQLGDCSVNYGNRWSADYLGSRKNVYNTYERAWETMSFSQALLNYAVQRLLGVRTDLNQNRLNYTSQEIQRREALIYELQNNVNGLEDQLGYTRERLDSDVNIIIRL